MVNMDKYALELVLNYAVAHLDPTDKDVYVEPYIVWKCKTLQNWKWMISTNISDGMYYEVTFNGAKYEFYLDAYKKFENVCIAFENLCK